MGELFKIPVESLQRVEFGSNKGCQHFCQNQKKTNQTCGRTDIKCNNLKKCSPLHIENYLENRKQYFKGERIKQIREEMEGVNETIDVF